MRSWSALPIIMTGVLLSACITREGVTSPDLSLVPSGTGASYTTLSTPVGTLYGHEGEYYPLSGTTPNATIVDEETTVNIGCTEYACGAVYFMSHKGWFHETSQTLEYRVFNPETNSTIASDPGQTFSSWQWLTAMYGAKYMTKNYPVSGLPRCDVRAEGNTIHKAWFGKTISISGGVVTVNSVGVFGFVAANSVATPKNSPACPPMIENPCDNPYTEEIETECSGGGSGPLVAGGAGNTESPGEERGGGANSVWVCDAIFWYHSDDNGATWYYTGRYDIIGNCSLEAR